MHLQDQKLSGTLHRSEVRIGTGQIPKPALHRAVQLFQCHLWFAFAITSL